MRVRPVISFVFSSCFIANLLEILQTLSCLQFLLTDVVFPTGSDFEVI